MEINVENAHLVLKKYLEGTNQDKYEHSLRVAKISKELAQKWGASESDAIIVALLHDIGKSMNEQQMLSLCVRNNIAIYDFELFGNIIALHGKISALLFEEEFQGNDSQRIAEISHAISSHVAGDVNMKLLDKIIFIADNLDLKEGSMELLEQIKSDQANNPDYYIKKIIQRKFQRSQDNDRQHNPFLDATLEGMDEESR